MAVGDLRKRQEARQNARDDQRASAPSGITNGNTNPRLKNEDDRDAEQRAANNAARWNAAVASGKKPEDYGYDPVTRQKTPEYAGRKLMPKPAATTAPPSATTAPPSAATAPPTLLRPNAGQPKSLIDGEDSGAALKRMRAEATARGEQPFAASKSERAYDAGLTRTKEANEREASAKSAAATKPPGTPATDVVATPKPLVAPPSSAKPPGSPSPDTTSPETTPSATEPSPGSSSGANPDVNWDARELRGAATGALAARVMGAGLGRATIGAANMAGDLSAARITSKGFADLGKVAANEANQISSSLKSLDFAGKADKAQKTADAGADLLAKAKAGMPRAYRTLAPTNAPGGIAVKNLGGPKIPLIRASNLNDAANVNLRNLAGAASDGATMEANAIARFTDITEKGLQAEADVAKALKATKTTGGRIVNALAKATEVASKVPGAGLLKAAGKVAGKVAVPLEFALMGKEVYDLTDAKHREARAKEFEGYAKQGALRSAAESALNPVAGIYSAGHQLNELSKSNADASAAASALKSAQSGFDKRQALMAAEGHTRESLAKLSQKERSAIMKSIRTRAA